MGGIPNGTAGWLWGMGVLGEFFVSVLLFSYVWDLEIPLDVEFRTKSHLYEDSCGWHTQTVWWRRLRG